jgi:hypothetical protein
VQYTNHVLIAILVIAWYLLTVVFHFFKMANPNSEHFHIGVYQILRKAEFDAFSPFLKDSRNRFTFEAMKNWFYSHGGYAELYFARKEWDQEREEYERLLDEYYAEILEVTNENIKLMDEKHKVTLYLLNLLSKAKTNVERLVNNRYGKDDLAFFCPYTLYELVDDEKLVLITDVGTGANAKEEILLAEHPEFASVQVLTHKEPVLYQRISRNKTILSYRMIMPDQKIWVMNLHINDNDEKTLEFLFGDVIIDSQELLELVRAYCWLFKKYVLDVEESSGSTYDWTSTGTTGRDN